MVGEREKQERTVSLFFSLTSTLTQTSDEVITKKGGSLKKTAKEK